MTSFAVSRFAGEAPRIAPRQLADNMAQTAENTKLWSTLEPFKESLDVVAKAAANLTKDTIYPFGQTLVGQPVIAKQPMIGFPIGGAMLGGSVASPINTIVVDGDNYQWSHWPADIDVARGAIAGDKTERTYYTGDGIPKVTTMQMSIPASPTGISPAESYPLGINAPTRTPTLLGNAGGSGVAETRSYVYTLVSIWGEESAPSPALLIGSVLPGATVTIGNLSTAIIPANISAQRIYRTNTAANGTAEFQFVDEIDVTLASYADSKAATALGEILPSVGWLPPNSKLKGMMPLPNGGMAGFYDNVVSLCVSWKPYAWPIANQYPTEHPIVAVGSYGSTVVVLTIGNPYLLSGIDPSAMSMSKLPSYQPCVSKRSVVSLGYGVAYASPDGLMVVSSNSEPVNATKNYMTRDEWQALRPSSINAYVYDGRYFGFYDNGTTKGGFILDPSSSEDGLVHVTMHASAGYADLVTDALYLMVNTGTPIAPVPKIVRWDGAATALVMKWRSKIFTAASPVNLGYALVRAAAYPVTLRVFAGGQLKHTEVVANDDSFKLPSGFLSRDWEFEVEGQQEIYGIAIADTIDGVRSV